MISIVDVSSFDEFLPEKEKDEKYNRGDDCTIKERWGLLLLYNESMFSIHRLNLAMNESISVMFFFVVVFCGLSVSMDLF